MPVKQRFTTDPAESHTLPAHYYYDPAIYQREQEDIFARTWQLVGHKEQLSRPGDYITPRVAGEHLLLMTGEDGIVRAFYNVCSHRAHELLRGSGNTSSLVCPYHAWSYQLDGTLKHARNAERIDQFDPRQFYLKAVQVEEFLNFVFVNLDQHASSLRSQMGAIEPELRSFAPRLDELTFSTRLTYHLKANWKNVMENFNECYHCPNAHANLCENALKIESYKIDLFEFHQRHRSEGIPPRDAVCDYDPDVSEHGDKFGAWYLWPNLALEVYPGGFLNVFHVIPSGPEAVVEHVDFYLYQREPTEREAVAIKYRHDYVQLEDVALVESVQRGLRSRSYADGRLMVDHERSDKSEHAVHHIQSLVSRALSPTT